MKQIDVGNDLAEKLKDNIILQAKNYLKEFDEFYPFAAIIENTGEVRPTGVYFGEEHPSKPDVLNNLEQALRKGAEDKGCKAAAIGIDVLTIPPGKQQKMDAIEIRVDVKEHGSINYYVPYEKLESGEYKFYDVFTNKGTLSLW